LVAEVVTGVVPEPVGPLLVVVVPPLLLVEPVVVVDAPVVVGLPDVEGVVPVVEGPEDVVADVDDVTMALLNGQAPLAATQAELNWPLTRLLEHPVFAPAPPWQ